MLKIVIKLWKNKIRFKPYYLRMYKLGILKPRFNHTKKRSRNIAVKISICASTIAVG